MPRVLIAEDDELIRKLLRTIVERSGCEAALAADGAEAITLLTSRVFDLLLLDLMMPVLNGYEVLQHVRTMNTRPAVLVVTAMVGDRYLELDGDVVAAVIHKPFDTQMLGSIAAEMAGAMASRLPKFAESHEPPPRQLDAA